MIKIFGGIDDDINVSILNFETRCSISTFAGLMVGSDNAALISLFLLRIGFVRIQGTIICLGHLFGCSLRPGMLSNSPWKLAASILSWSLTLPIKQRPR